MLLSIYADAVHYSKLKKKRKKEEMEKKTGERQERGKRWRREVTIGSIIHEFLKTE